jgi:hypothetical protein
MRTSQHLKPGRKGTK